MVETDKNFMLGVIDTRDYYAHMYKHLGDALKYRRLTKEEAKTEIKSVRTDLEEITQEYFDKLLDNEHKYFDTHMIIPCRE